MRSGGSRISSLGLAHRTPGRGSPYHSIYFVKLNQGNPVPWDGKERLVLVVPHGSAYKMRLDKASMKGINVIKRLVLI